MAVDLDVNGTRQIFVVDADGSNLTQLTTGGAKFGGVNPAWSPDGIRLVFGSDRDGGVDLYTVNADGSNLTRLTNTFEDEFPAFPDW